MKQKFAIILAVMVLAVTAALAQTASPAPLQNGPSLRITEPQAGQKINTSFVSVKFELVNTGAAANVPRYRVQMDGRDPVSISATEYTFTGVRPGNHVVDVELIDANNTPIDGAHGQVQFTVVPGPGSPAGELLPGNADPEALPAGGSELPLLSVIGFGVLLGGIISAMRTR